MKSRIIKLNIGVCSACARSKYTAFRTGSAAAIDTTIPANHDIGQRGQAVVVVVHAAAVTGLAGVFDSRFWGGKSRHHLYQFVFMGKLVDGQEMGNGSHKQEVLDVAWFAEEDLPLAEMDANHVGRVAVMFDVWQGEKRPFFDS